MALVSPTTRYTVQTGDRQFGPHTRAEIASMFKAGMVDGTAYVWCEGWPDWKPIAAILPSVLAQIAVKAGATPHEPAADPVPATAVVRQPEAEPQAVIEPIAAPQVVPEYAAPLSAAPQQPALRRKHAGYIARVGLRSFIFQIALAVWTLSYGGWLISVAASATSHASGTSSSMRPTSPMAANPFDLSAGIFSSWICVAGGWCVIGLPLGIAAVSTLNEPGR